MLTSIHLCHGDCYPSRLAAAGLALLLYWFGKCTSQKCMHRRTCQFHIGRLHRTKLVLCPLVNIKNKPAKLAINYIMRTIIMQGQAYNDLPCHQERTIMQQRPQNKQIQICICSNLNLNQNKFIKYYVLYSNQNFQLMFLITHTLSPYYNWSTATLLL